MFGPIKNGLYCLCGLVVKCLSLQQDTLGSIPAFLVKSYTSDLRADTVTAALFGAWCYRISTRTGRPDVTTLLQDETKFEHECLDTSYFGCLICMCFIFLYLHLFSTIEHVSNGKAL